MWISFPAFSFPLPFPQTKKSFYSYHAYCKIQVCYVCMLLYLTCYIRCTGIGATRDQGSHRYPFLVPRRQFENSNMNRFIPVLFFNFPPTTSSPALSKPKQHVQATRQFEGTDQRPKSTPEYGSGSAQHQIRLPEDSTDGAIEQCLAAILASFVG